MLHLVPKEEFVYAMGGFLLSYRFPVLYRELISKGALCTVVMSTPLLNCRVYPPDRRH